MLESNIYKGYRYTGRKKRKLLDSVSSSALEGNIEARIECNKDSDQAISGRNELEKNLIGEDHGQIYLTKVRPVPKDLETFVSMVVEPAVTPADHPHWQWPPSIVRTAPPYDLTLLN